MKNNLLLSLFCFFCFIVIKATFAETILQEFNSMTELNAFWDKSSWSNNNRTHSPDNVSVNNGILVLKLSGSQPGQLPVCAEITSKRSDFKYGSYRASIKTTNIAGGVVGWFVYRGSPLNEIDVEFLTQDISYVHYTLHHIQTSVDYKKYKLNFDASADFHEYRFDWYPDSVQYFIDGKPTATLKNQVPDMECKIMLNHWSGNIQGWGGPAPTVDIYMYVDYVLFTTEYNLPTSVIKSYSDSKNAFVPVKILQSNDVIKFIWNKDFIQEKIFVINPMGQTLNISDNYLQIHNCEMEINKKMLSSGNYFLVFKSSNNSKVFPFIIK